jgi:hypothetical protein
MKYHGSSLEIMNFLKVSSLHRYENKIPLPNFSIASSSNGCLFVSKGNLCSIPGRNLKLENPSILLKAP